MRQKAIRRGRKELRPQVAHDFRRRCLGQDDERQRQGQQEERAGAVEGKKSGQPA